MLYFLLIANKIIIININKIQSSFKNLVFILKSAKIHIDMSFDFIII